MQNRLKTTLLAAAMLAAGAVSTEAQQAGRFYAGVNLGAHHESADRVTGTTSVVGVTVGFRLRRAIGVEIDLNRPQSEFSREYTGTSVSFAGPGASREEIERLAVVTRFINSRRVLSTFSAGVAYYIPASGRWSPRLFLGVTNHMARERTELIHLSIPEGIDPERVRRTMPEQAPFLRELGGLTIGGSVGFAVTRHLSIAPDLRYDYGSIGDEINNVLRTSVRVLWSF
jgi:hypothetical protein